MANVRVVSSGDAIESRADYPLTPEEWREDVTARLTRLEKLVSRAERGGIATAVVLIGDVAVERWLPKFIEYLPKLLEALQ